MLTGSDLRRYRKALGMRQGEFAKRLDLAQSTLSLIEGGRIAVSLEHLARLSSEFTAPEFKPSFKDFQAAIIKEAGSQQAALTAPGTGHVTLPVWAWDEHFDLGRRPEPSSSLDLVMLRGLQQPAVALRMPRRTEHWAEGEVFVFERCDSGDVKNAEICLLQVRPPRARAPKTMIAIARLASAKRGRALQYEPVSPGGPVFAGGDSVLATLRAVFRARHLK